MQNYPESLWYLVGVPEFDHQHSGVRSKGAFFDLNNDDRYDPIDRFLLFANFAETSGIAYVNIQNLRLKYNQGQEDELYSEMAAECARSAGGTAIIDGVGCFSDSVEESVQLMAAIQKIAQIAKEQPENMPRRIFIPMTIEAFENNPKRYTHMSALVLEFDKESQHFGVYQFEPIVHNQYLDYRPSIEHVQDVVEQNLEEEGFSCWGMANALPYTSDRRNTCQVINVEAIKTLVLSKKPLAEHIVDPSDLMMCKEDVDAAHARNLRVIARFMEDEQLGGNTERTR